jgi:hypothetical protein
MAWYLSLCLKRFIKMGEELMKIKTNVKAGTGTTIVIIISS